MGAILIIIRSAGVAIGTRVLQRLGDPTRWQDRLPPGLIFDRAADSTVTDEDLAAEILARTGMVVSVATYSEPFELRKVHFQWSVTSGDIAGEDVRVCTFHLLKLSAGSPTGDWVAADFTNVDEAFATWWTTLRPYFAPATGWSGLKVYKAGPDIEPPQVPVFSNEFAANLGTGAGSQLPPQIAVTVTERAGTKKHWGRFYLPAPASLATVLGTQGRLHATFQNALADATDTCYQSLLADGLVPVVYRPPLPVRQTAEERRNNVTPGSLPARSGSAWTVDEISVDNIFDVIRTRRYERPTSRSDRAVA